jgi:hypothetical protein
MLAQINAEALIDRLQDFALGSDGDAMSESQVDVALALLDRTLPDLHGIRLTDGRPRVKLGEAATHRLVEA